MPPAPQGAPHGTSVCREVRDTADVGQEGRTVLGELWGPSLNTRCCLIPWGWRPPRPAGTGSLGTAEGWRSRQPPALRVWAAGTAWGSDLSSPPSRPVWPSLGCGAGSAELPHATRTPQAPRSFPPLPAFAPARSGEGWLLSPLEETRSRGGSQSAGALLAPWGPAAGSSPVPSPSLMLCMVIFLNTVFILTSL